ncbi:MAG: hypothetical protein R3293_21835 [Candidatus Promineifilaceae bacterium]|nr:hypothetical protein [Candidatus Promineifilaceae bacterium]
MTNVEIYIKGHLDQQWLEWLGDFTLVHTAENESILSGQIQDQAALYGLFGKLRDLGVTLVAVKYQQTETHVESERLNTV